ncbi:MAG: EAL domain-containing protein [Rubrivivax sp.]|nr:EAL domain-containing protein [Rubrivivax sp.]
MSFDLLARHDRRLQCLVLTLLLLFGVVLDAAALQRREVFVLHSYSQEYPWTKRQHEGFLGGLARDTGHRYGVQTEYLDTKRARFDAAYEQLMADHLAAKYRGYKPDAVYVTDDNALVFALDHLGRIFPNAPLIFSGINDFDIQRRLDPARMTGVFERKEIAPNLDLVRLISPDVGDIVVVGDDSETYRAIAQEVRGELGRYPGIRARFLADRQLDKVLDGLRAGTERFVILTTLGALVDANGSPLMLDQSLSAIAGLQRHTIISMEDVYLQQGVLGGYVTSGIAQGEAAARLMVRHFGGEPIDAIAPLLQSPNQYLVDDRELQRAGLRLPPAIAAQATILNPLPGIYQRHQRAIVVTLCLLAAMLGLSLAAGLLLVLRKNRQIGANAGALRRQSAQMVEVQDSLVRAQQIAAVGNWDLRISDNHLFCSDEIYRIFGIERSGRAASARTFLARVHADDRHAVAASLRRTRESGQACDITYRIVLPDGSVRFVRENAELECDTAGSAVRLIGTVMDVTARERTERALRESEDTLRKVIEGLPVVLWMVDVDGRFLLSEGKGLQAMGLEPGQVVGESLFVHYADFPEIVDDTRRALGGQSFACTRQLGPLVFELRYSPLRDEADEIKGAIGVAIDITERKQSEDRLVFLANYDPVTELPNRFLFGDRLTHAMHAADRQRSRVALLFVDLDNFKNINDSLGHAAGDELLKQVATRLGLLVRSSDTVSRLGGDEFTVILENLAHDDEAVRVAASILDQALRPYAVGSREVYVTASVGIAIYPQDGASVDLLLMNADAAMYRAKENGRNAFEFFTQDINARAQERLELGNELRGALGRNEFSLHYQPKVAMADSAVVGFEALLRWRNPRLGAVSPAVFVPVLEEIGLIVDVGEWVLQEACRWAAGLRGRCGQAPSISVNLSARQFRHPNLDRMVHDTLLATGLPAARLELEITESSLMDLESNLQTMDRLKRLGVGLSIDDFGTGYSSLSYLKRFPVDELKIDASFVRDVAVDRDDAAIVVAIIGLAHHLHLKVIAEGVETQEQLAFLRRHGCDEVQGYLIARPMPAEQAQGWLGDQQAAAASSQHLVAIEA